MKRLTELSHGAGCGCKLAPAVLRGVLDRLTPPDAAELIVGSGSGDDAAVWRLDDRRALVVTTDFFTPIVDSPRTWGAIAATNAVSDVYAMGGRPLLALNLVAWNTDELPIEMLHDVLAGAGDVAHRAGFVIAGGHSIDDPEPKYGLAVVGEADPHHLLTNRGLRDGDALVLTKPLGTGVIATAIKRDVVPPDALDAAVASMLRLNDEAARVALELGATGATDVTGFGLLGHAARMAAESRVDVELSVGAVPLLPGARGLAEAGCTPGGTGRNLDHVLAAVDRGGASDVDLALLADPQTSGGLLFGVEPASASDAVARLADTGHHAAVVGAARPGSGRIVLR